MNFADHFKLDFSRWQNIEGQYMLIGTMPEQKDVLYTSSEIHSIKRYEIVAWKLPLD